MAGKSFAELAVRRGRLEAQMNDLQSKMLVLRAEYDGISSEMAATQESTVSVADSPAMAANREQAGLNALKQWQASRSGGVDPAAMAALAASRR